MRFKSMSGSGPAYPSQLLQVYTLRLVHKNKRKIHGFRLSLALDPTFGIHSRTAQPSHLLKPK